MNRRFLFILFLLVLIGLSTGAVAAQNSYSLWFAHYYSNPNLEGTPVASASTGEINYDWGEGSPASGVPSDHWSGQWTTYVDFSPGTYRITTQNDDGVRVWLGDKHVISDWNKHPVVTNQATVSLLGGRYSMAVDYFDDVMGAVLRLAWERIGPPKPGALDVTIISSAPIPPPTPPPSQGTWVANYWNNTSLSGTPVLTRNEAAINYDWGSGSPAPGIVSDDNFSARWSQTLYFENGSYRFTTQSDDGIRVWVAGHLIIDNWTTHTVTTNTADINLGTGSHAVVVEYFEQGGVAVAKFWWERIGEGGGGPTGVTATTLPYGLNLRAGPGTNFPILTALFRGTTVPVIGRTSTSRWIQVIFRDTTGWLSTPYTTVHGDLNSVPVTWQ